MSSTIRRRSGMSPTTVVLVLVLLGAVAGATRLVSPHPPGPPSEVKQDAVVSASQAEATKKEHLSMMNNQMTKQKAMMGMQKAPEDPNTIKVDNSYFITHKPGEEGLKQNDKEFEAKDKVFKEYQRRREAEQANKVMPKPVPVGTTPK